MENQTVVSSLYKMILLLVVTCLTIALELIVMWANKELSYFNIALAIALCIYSCWQLRLIINHIDEQLRKKS